MGLRIFKKVLAILSVVLCCFCIISCTNGRAVPADSDESSSKIELPETDSESYSNHLYEPVKQNDESSFAAYRYPSGDSSLTDEEKNTLVYYDFSSMTYSEISVKEIKRTSTEGVFMNPSPIIVEDRIYVFQQRYYKAPAVVEIYTDTDNKVFVYSTETGTSEVFDLPENYYFEGMLSSGLTDGNVVLIRGCEKLEDGSVEDAVFQIDLDDLSVEKSDIALNDITINRKLFEATGGRTQYMNLDGSKRFAFTSGNSNDGILKWILYEAVYGTDDIRVITDDLYPDGYGATMNNSYVFDDQYAYFTGINIEKQTAADFVLDLADGQATIINEQDDPEDTMFLTVRGATEDKLILTQEYNLLNNSVDPEAIAVVEKSDYLTGVFEPEFFTKG
ncbi:MAG: hypothetical protein IKE27_10775 [Oscillospiraceae bacterium]|nr:hypothetical protein [Oscillospiraceae bacterium]